MIRKLAGEWLCAWIDARAEAQIALGWDERFVRRMAKFAEALGTSIHRDPPDTLREQAAHLRAHAKISLWLKSPRRHRMVFAREHLALAAIFDLAASEAETETQPKGS